MALLLEMKCLQSEMKVLQLKMKVLKLECKLLLQVSSFSYLSSLDHEHQSCVLLMIMH